MGQPDLMRYQFAGLEDGKAFLAKAVQDAEQELSDLERSLAGILAQWEGSGDSTYLEVKAIWRTAHQQFQEIGQQIGLTVGDINQVMQSTEGEVVATLRSHTV